MIEKKPVFGIFNFGRGPPDHRERFMFAFVTRQFSHNRGQRQAIFAVRGASFRDLIQKFDFIRFTLQARNERRILIERIAEIFRRTKNIVTLYLFKQSKIKQPFRFLPPVHDCHDGNAGYAGKIPHLAAIARLKKGFARQA